MCLSCLLTSLALLSQTQTVNFDPPIDALSVQIEEGQTMEVRGQSKDETWGAWQELHLENEQDPTLHESNLVIFPKSVVQIELRAASHGLRETNNEKRIIVLHPVRVSHTPLQFISASNDDFTVPRIITRSEWGANDELLYVDTEHPEGKTEDKDTNGTPSTPEKSQREIDCEQAQNKYPDEFKSTGKKVTKGEGGRVLRWAHTYSKKISLLVVHHTAIAVSGDTRSSTEKVRALYQYHSVNRGWGDVGYHYLIGDDGKIFEGKSGGKFVIGGHAYCHNTATLGIAMLGNFDTEQPTQSQMRSLQWLLKYLSEEYDINPNNDVAYHGISRPAILGHGDLLSTDCPGYYVRSTLSQVRDHVRSGLITAAIDFPPPPAPRNLGEIGSPSIGPPEAQSEDETSVDARRLGRIDRKMRTAVRLSASTGGRAAQLEKMRQGIKNVTSSSVEKRRPVSVLRPSTVLRMTPARNDTMVHLLLTRENRIITLPLEEYLLGLGEEPDTEPYEKQRAFAIAARTYALYYLDPTHRKFPGLPYDATDDPATFQKYSGPDFTKKNPQWVKAVKDTANQVLTKNGEVIRPPYFSSDTGTTRTPIEAGWNNFPFAEIFTSKNDPWCAGLPLAGHGVGMSGCGAKGQANEGKTGEQILQYYYPGTIIDTRAK